MLLYGEYFPWCTHVNTPFASAVARGRGWEADWLPFFTPGTNGKKTRRRGLSLYRERWLAPTTVDNNFSSEVWLSVS